MHVGERSVEILSLILRTVVIVLTVHYLEIRLETLFYLLNNIAFWSIGIDWLSSLPVILVPLLEKAVISNSITGHFVDILHLVRILMSSTPLIEELLVVGVVRPVIL